MTTYIITLKVNGSLDLEVDAEDILNLSDILLPITEESLRFRGSMFDGDLFLEKFTISEIAAQKELL
jgi:hypothetical protein